MTNPDTAGRRSAQGNTLGFRRARPGWRPEGRAVHARGALRCPGAPRGHGCVSGSRPARCSP